MAFYLVRAEIIVSAVEFDPCVLTAVSSVFKRAWRVGDLVRPGGSIKFKDAGVRYELLESIEDPDWLELLITALNAWVEKFKEKFELIPTPLVSICVSTGGTDFPPLYFSRRFLSLIEEMKAEVDVDIIATAALEKCED